MTEDIIPVLSEGWWANSYIIGNFLVDAGARIEGVEPKVIILTHCHFDHCAAVEEIQRETGCEVWMSREEARFFERGRRESSAADFFGVEVDLGFEITRVLSEGDEIGVGKKKYRVVLTPGHTPGSISLYEPKGGSLISGDTLFVDGVGRSDLPGGDENALLRSLERLSEMEIKNLYPGHGPLGRGNIHPH